MSNPAAKPIPFLAALLVLTMLLVACGGRVRGDMVQAANVPSGFDVTILADKDNQFDYDGAPLTTEDLKSALRYRQEQSLPVATVLMKRGEKQKVTNQHIIELARVAYQLKIKAFIQDKSGEISEIRAQLKEGESETPEPQASK